MSPHFASNQCSDNMNNQRAFVIGTAVELVQDLRLLSVERVVQAAVADTGGLTSIEYVQAACVDRAVQTASAQLPMGTTFNVVNGTLNAAKTLMLARQLITSSAFECTLALGIDRQHQTRAHRTTATHFDTDALIRNFDRVRRRFHVDVRREAEHEHVWLQSERFEERWCDTDVLVACVLANEAFVQRHGLQHTAVEIVRMELEFGDDDAAIEHTMPRLISVLGFVNDAPHCESALCQSGLKHCADASKTLRDDRVMRHDVDTRASQMQGTETLFAQYRRYNDPIKAKL